MKNQVIKRCCCCGRQIVSYSVSVNDKYVCSLPATKIGLDKWCCKICSEELDENGLFPEEGGDNV